MTKLEATIQEYSEAVDNFEEILKRREDPRSLDYAIIRDSAIKRFELAFDMSWKVVKAWLEEKGTICVSPLDCFREAYRGGIIEYQDVWTRVVKTRNKTAHVYKEKLAEEVYSELPEFLAAFQDLKNYFTKNQP